MGTFLIFNIFGFMGRPNVISREKVLTFIFSQICKPPASSWAPVGAGSDPGDKALFWHAAHHGVLQAGEGGVQGGRAGVLGQRRMILTCL